MKKASDERWVTAIEAADSLGDLRELLRTLRHIGAVPEWVAEELSFLFKDRRLSRPRPTSQQEELQYAAFLYSLARKRKPQAKRDDDIARIARESGVSKVSLQNLLDGRGRLARRVRSRSRSKHPTV